MRLFLKFTGGFYILWSFVEVFLIFLTLSQMNAQPDAPNVKFFYIQIAGFFLKMLVGTMAFLVERKREFALAGVIFACLDVAHCVYTLATWQQNRITVVFYLVIDVTLAAFLFLVYRKWKVGGPAPFAPKVYRGQAPRPSANAYPSANAGTTASADMEKPAPYPPIAPYPPVKQEVAREDNVEDKQ